MSYSSTCATDSPISAWRFGEPTGTNAADAQGVNAGTYIGLPTLGVTGLIAGDSDTAVTLNGTSQYITLANQSTLPSGAAARTIEAWFNPSTALGVPLFLYGNTGTNSWCYLFIETDGRVRVNNLTSQVDLAPAGTITLGTTTHLVAVYDGAYWTCYVNGSAFSPVAQTMNTVLTGGWPQMIGYDLGWFLSTYLKGTLDEVRIYGTALTSTRVAVHYADGTTAVSPVWTTPADTVSMSTTPDLKFTSPASAAKQHFQLQLDTAATFDSGNLRTLDSSTSQTNWTYWNGSSWVSIPSDGLPIAYAGNEVDYAVTSALSGATWYRRVRAGTLV